MIDNPVSLQSELLELRRRGDAVRPRIEHSRRLLLLALIDYLSAVKEIRSQRQSLKTARLLLTSMRELMQSNLEIFSPNKPN